MRYKYIWVDIIANINNLKKKMYQQIHWKIPLPCMYNFNVKFLIIKKLGTNILNILPWVLYWVHFYLSLSYINLYNHFKFKHVKIVRTIFLNTSPVLVNAHPMWIKWRRREKLHVHNQCELTPRSSFVVWLYALFPSFDIIQKYIPGDRMLILSMYFWG